MTVKVKVLALDALTNTTEKNLYSPSTAGPDSAIVKTMRFVNTSGVPATLDVYFVPNGGTFASDKRHVFPRSLGLAVGALALDEDELTLSAGDSIWAKVSAPGGSGDLIECVISGIERNACVC